MYFQYLFIGVDSLQCKFNSLFSYNLMNSFVLVLIMNFILDFLGYLYLFLLIVGLKSNGQQKVNHYVHEKILFIYVY
jgi:hypothetical protein